MNIVHVCYGCIRVFKEAIALQAKRHRVNVWALTMERVPPFGPERVPFNLFHRGELQAMVKRSKADVFHCHNEPDWFVREVADAADGRPVIFDVHDLASMRHDNGPDHDELEAFVRASGVVHVSEWIRADAERIHGARKPTLVLPCDSALGRFSVEAAMIVDKPVSVRATAPAAAVK